MGDTRFTDDDWKDYSTSVRGKTVDEVFTSTTMKTASDPRKSFDPKTIEVRESRDSKSNPNSTPIVIAFDVTGSMGSIPHYFVQEGIGKLMQEIFDRKPVNDPHIMCLAFGDATCDRAPLQATQFEADIKIAKQLEEIYLEGDGGRNEGESYNLPWYFAATKTSADNFEKRGKKGLLFTIGDEPPLEVLRRAHIKKFLGDDVECDLTSAEILEMVQRQYDVFHVIVEQGAGFSGSARKKEVLDGWNKLLGQGHILRLTDYTKLSEVIISAIQVNAGEDLDRVVKSWSGDTSVVVADALSKELVASRPGKKGVGPVRVGAKPAVA